MARLLLVAAALCPVWALQGTGNTEADNRGLLDSCTAIIVGKTAGTEGPMTTHTADCSNCDYRISKVEAADHEEGATVDIFQMRAAYPRYIGNLRGETFYAKNTYKGGYDWPATKPIGTIPQVPHTYAYIDGIYAIMNEHGLAFGESTCGGKLINVPVNDGGRALFDLTALTRIGMERCKTARCAISTMGQIAQQYGFYGAEWKGPDAYGESGEALTITDPEEAWVFHIHPDDQGASAVWVAQRVPDDHVSVVSNQFVIRKVNFNDPDNFLYSDNLLTVARRTGFFQSDNDDDFDFAAAFSKPMFNRAPYATRRQWRVLTKASPSSNLPGETDTLANDYPFSVKADKALTPQDIMSLNRDHFEGTPYDTTQGPMGGPWGNPNRYDTAANPTEPDPVTAEEALKGHVERTISLFRTVYSFVTQSRSGLPNAMAPMMWFSQHQPSSAIYSPLYVVSEKVPESFWRCNRYEFDEKCAFWVNMAVSNYMTVNWNAMVGYVRQNQHRIEADAFAQREKVERKAIAALSRKPKPYYGGGGERPAGTGGADEALEEARRILQEFSLNTAEGAVETWWSFFKNLIVRFHDGYRISDEDLTGPTLTGTKLFYPKWWLQSVGYWGYPDIKVAPQQQQHPWVAALAPTEKPTVTTQLASAGDLASPSSHAEHTVAWVVACGSFAALGAVAGALVATKKREAYSAIP